MVCLTEDYRTFHNTGRVYGKGVRGFGIRGMGVKDFGRPELDTFNTQSVMVQRGNGLPSWLKRVKDRAVVLGRKALPWAQAVLTQLAKDHASDVAQGLANEIERSNPDSNIAKVAANITRRTGSVAQKQLNKATKDQKLSPGQNIAKGALSDTTGSLLRQMIANRKNYQERLAASKQQPDSEGNGIAGFGTAQNIITY